MLHQHSCGSLCSVTHLEVWSESLNHMKDWHLTHFWIVGLTNTSGVLHAEITIVQFPRNIYSKVSVQHTVWVFYSGLVYSVYSHAVHPSLRLAVKMRRVQTAALPDGWRTPGSTWYFDLCRWSPCQIKRSYCHKFLTLTNHRSCPYISSRGGSRTCQSRLQKERRQTRQEYIK